MPVTTAATADRLIAFLLDRVAELKREQYELLLAAKHATSKHATSKPKILWITDMGRDIDDTIALFAQCSMNVDMVGVVTSGGSTLKRAQQCRAWLRHLGVSDEACGVAAGPEFASAPFAKSRSYGGVEEIEHLCPAPTTAGQSNPYNLHSDSTELILSLAKQYGRELTVIGVGPLSPLAAALEAEQAQGGNLLKSIRAVYLQGIVQFEPNANTAAGGATTGAGRIYPNISKSYNFREDAAAAEMVFAQMQVK